MEKRRHFCAYSYCKRRELRFGSHSAWQHLENDCEKCWAAWVSLPAASEHGGQAGREQRRAGTAKHKRHRIQTASFFTSAFAAGTPSHTRKLHRGIVAAGSIKRLAGPLPTALIAARGGIMDGPLCCHDHSV